jgi:dethiobiotin synthetase
MFFVTGTDTNVGKTVVTAYLIAIFQQSGKKAVAYKPVQSGGRREGEKLIAEDVEVYRAVADLEHAQELLCTYCFQDAVSPHLAAKREAENISLHKIKQRYEELSFEHDVVLVEGAGGLAVPISHYDEVVMTPQLVQLLNLPIIIVTRPNLGTINHTVLTVEYAKAQGLQIAGIIVNNASLMPSYMEIDNREMIEKITGVPIIGQIPTVSVPVATSLKDSISRNESFICLNRLEEWLK